MSIKTDVLIVGGGPAGLASAIAIRQRGLNVTLVDAMKPPIDKACGEGLMPDSLRDLAALGIDLTPADGMGFRGIRFINHHIGSRDSSVAEQTTASFPQDEFAHGQGVGLRRQTLHRKLVQRAQEIGCDLRWQSHVHFLDKETVTVAGESVQSQWLIGADGHGSRVRSWAGLEAGTVLSKRFGFRRHFAVKPWSPYVEVHWGKTGQAYVTPVGPNEVCVATISRSPNFRIAPMLLELPRLAQRLGVETPSSVSPFAVPGSPASSELAVDRERGAVTTTRRLRRVAKGRVALVGDASGSADAITGEGMGMGFRQALLLAECLESGNLSRYNQQHPSILKLPQTMAQVMMLMDRHKIFRDRAIHMLASEPKLFGRMLGVHLGAESILHFAAGKGLELAWRMAQPMGVSRIVEA